MCATLVAETSNIPVFLCMHKSSGLECSHATLCDLNNSIVTLSMCLSPLFHPLSLSPRDLRMKKEMVSKVNAVAGEFRKVSDLQMAETTKRAIRENVAINQQLGRMSDKTMELLRENEALKVREKDLRRQLEVLEYNEKELAKKNINSQKVWGGGGDHRCSTLVRHHTTWEQGQGTVFSAVCDMVARNATTYGSHTDECKVKKHSRPPQVYFTN